MMGSSIAATRICVSLSTIGSSGVPLEAVRLLIHMLVRTSIMDTDSTPLSASRYVKALLALRQGAEETGQLFIVVRF